MAGAFSLLRDQPKYGSPGRPSLGAPPKALLCLSHRSIQLPCLGTSKPLPASEIVFLLDVWLVHFLSPLEGQDLSCQAHCFIHSIRHAVKFSSNSSGVSESPSMSPQQTFSGTSPELVEVFGVLFCPSCVCQSSSLIHNRDPSRPPRHTFVERCCSTMSEVIKIFIEELFVARFV